MVKALESGEQLSINMIAVTASGSHELPGQMLMLEFTLPVCGSNKISVNPSMETVFAYGKRYNAGLSETEILCQGTDCINESPEWEINDGPLVSSDPSCPITDIQMMYDDGNGIPTHAIDPNMFRFERIGTTQIRSVANNTAIT
jgi:hypothetical protein